MVQAEQGPGSQTVPSTPSPPAPHPDLGLCGAATQGAIPTYPFPSWAALPGTGGLQTPGWGDQVSLQRWDLCGLFQAKPSASQASFLEWSRHRQRWGLLGEGDPEAQFPGLADLAGRLCETS